jgi:hypothetical protein
MARVDRVAEAINDVAMRRCPHLRGHPSSSLWTALQPVLHQLVHTLGADAAGYYVHQWNGWTTALAIAPDDVWPRVPNAHTPTLQAAAAHPGIRHSVAHPNQMTPFALTDLISETAWLSSELGTLMRPDWGRNYQMAIPVPPASMCANRAYGCSVASMPTSVPATETPQRL